MSPEPKVGSVVPVQLVDDLLMADDYIQVPAPIQWLRKVNKQQVHLTVDQTVWQRDNPYRSGVRKL